MRTVDIQRLAADVKKLTTESRSTGPRSDRGKARSSLNAVRHGLAAMHMLLPGEDAAEYERRMDAVFVALDPKNEAQAQLVALVADDLWKLERLAKIEQGVTLGRIEELLALTSSSAPANEIASAMAALMSGLSTWEQTPLPLEHGPEFEHRMHVLTRALDLARSSKLPHELLTMLEDLVGKLLANRDVSLVPMDTYYSLAHVARLVLNELAARAQQLDAEQDDLRRAIAVLALPDEQELKKLGRYRKLLEDGLQRRLAVLEQLRTLGNATAKTEDERTAVREYRLKLRVVA